jgi:hypothetical protein
MKIRPYDSKNTKCELEIRIECMPAFLRGTRQTCMLQLLLRDTRALIFFPFPFFQFC